MPSLLGLCCVLIGKEQSAFATAQDNFEHSHFFGRVLAMESHHKPLSSVQRLYGEVNSGIVGSKIMKRLVELLFDVRICVVDISETIGFILLVAYSVLKAWEDFMNGLKKTMASVDVSWRNLILV